MTNLWMRGLCFIAILGVGVPVAERLIRQTSGVGTGLIIKARFLNYMVNVHVQF